MGMRINIDLHEVVTNPHINVTIFTEQGDPTETSNRRSAVLSSDLPYKEGNVERVFDVEGDVLGADFNFFRHQEHHTGTMRLLFNAGISFRVV